MKNTLKQDLPRDINNCYITERFFNVTMKAGQRPPIFHGAMDK
jgi:hypothetical protein